MALVIEYARSERRSARELLTSQILGVLLTFAHINLCWQGSRQLIVSVCEHSAGNFVTWTPMAWLPGTVIANYLGETTGLICMAAMSVLAAHMLQKFLMTHRDGIRLDSSLLGDSRLWVIAALWLVWLPVPASNAFVYQFTDWAITH